MKWMMPSTPHDYANASIDLLQEEIEHRPSGHAIMTGEWHPTLSELKFGIFKGFGATIAAFRGETECGKIKNVKAKLREEAYIMIAKKFKLDDDVLQLPGEHLGCWQVKMP
jgi:hypothetical protein